MDLFNDLKTDKELHRSVLKFTTMMLVSKAISLQDAKFMSSLIGSIIGFTTYFLLIKKIDLNIVNDNPEIKKLTNTLVKVGTIMGVSHLYQGGKIDGKFVQNLSYSITAFNIADMIIHRFVPTLDNVLFEKILKDIILVLIVWMAKPFVTEGKMNTQLLLNATWTLCGFILYDIIEVISC